PVAVVAFFPLAFFALSAAWAPATRASTTTTASTLRNRRIAGTSRKRRNRFTHAPPAAAVRGAFLGEGLHSLRKDNDSTCRIGKSPGPQPKKNPAASRGCVLECSPLAPRVATRTHSRSEWTTMPENARVQGKVRFVRCG